MNKPVPKKGEHRVADMMSETASIEAKANAARWYAEMMIDLFLSDEAKIKIGEEKFHKLFLGDKIESINQSFNAKIIDSLWLIKDFGDKGSHYHPEQKLRETDVEKIVLTSINLFSYILVDHLKKEALNKTYKRAVIFSTLFPSVRENVLLELIDFNAINTDYDYELLHKYVLACVKNGNENTAKRRLKDLHKKEVINNQYYESEIETIQLISKGMKNGELPVPISIQDCKRNFDDVLKDLSNLEIKENKRLIQIIEKLLEQVEPSEMGSFIANKVYFGK